MITWTMSIKAYHNGCTLEVRPGPLDRWYWSARRAFPPRTCSGSEENAEAAQSAAIAEADAMQVLA
jgi:hypothetical protein